MRNFSAQHDRSRIQEIDDGCDACPQVHTRIPKHGVSELVARCESRLRAIKLDGALAGWSVPEHIGIGAQAQLIGEGLARYFTWAMRSLDYLAGRAGVDGCRIVWPVATAEAL